MDAIFMPTIRSKIVTVNDFPIKGIKFKDITPLLEDHNAFSIAINEMSKEVKRIVDNEMERVPESFKDKVKVKILAPESRGFIFGAPIAYKLGYSLVIARKPGKLPRPGVSAVYIKEYGADTIEISSGSIERNDIVVIIDDLLATGGSARALENIVEDCQANCIGVVTLIELRELGGNFLLKSPVYSLYKIGCINDDIIEVDTSTLVDEDQLRYSGLCTMRVIYVDKDEVCCEWEHDFETKRINVPKNLIKYVYYGSKKEPYYGED